MRLGIKRPGYNGKASFKTWLYTIARNIAVDHLRRIARNRTVSLDDCRETEDDALPLIEAVIKDEDKRTVHRTMARLKAEHRQILWLVYFEEMSVKDSATVIKKTVHATEMLVHRARLALKCELEKEGFTYENV